MGKSDLFVYSGLISEITRSCISCQPEEFLKVMITSCRKYLHHSETYSGIVLHFETCASSIFDNSDFIHLQSAKNIGKKGQKATKLCNNGSLDVPYLG